MKDGRVFWKTKTFYGAAAFGVCLVLEAVGIRIAPELYGLITIYTGYSVADRLRTKA